MSNEERYWLDQIKILQDVIFEDRNEIKRLENEIKAMRCCGNCENENISEELDNNGDIWIENKCPHYETCDINGYYNWKLKGCE